MMGSHGSCIPRSISQGFLPIRWRPLSSGLHGQNGLAPFKQVAGKTEVCQAIWWASLTEQMREQHITLELMTDR